MALHPPAGGSTMTGEHGGGQLMVPLMGEHSEVQSTVAFILVSLMIGVAGSLAMSLMTCGGDV